MSCEIGAAAFRFLVEKSREMSEESSGDESPDTKNRYLDSLIVHQSHVVDYETRMSHNNSGYAANPCSAVCKTIQDGAWKSNAADTWVEELDGVGNAVKNAFKNYLTAVNDAVSAEKPEIDVPGPDSWKVNWDPGQWGKYRNDRWREYKNEQNSYSSPFYGGTF